LFLILPYIIHLLTLKLLMFTALIVTFLSLIEGTFPCEGVETAIIFRVLMSWLSLLVVLIICLYDLQYQCIVLFTK
jgi:hypothetical protein